MKFNLLAAALLISNVSARTKEEMAERFKERDLIAQNNLPDSWCKDGVRK